MNIKCDEELMYLISIFSCFEAFNILIKKYSKIFYMIAFKTLQNDSQAKDACIDCHYNIWFYRKSFNLKKGIFFNWAYTILKNIINNILIAENKERKVNLDFVLSNTGEDIPVLKKSDYEKIIGAKPYYYLILKYSHKKPYTKIAELENKNVFMIRKIVKKAKEKILSYVGEKNGKNKKN